MMCLKPLTISNPKIKDKYKFYHRGHFDSEEYVRVYGKEAYIQVPCGHCESCIEQKSWSWASRVYYEWQYSKSAIFVTLTYAEEFLTWNPVVFKLGSFRDEFVVPVLCKRDVQLFMKRLRKRIGNGLRFFLGGEYGEQDGRPHYHFVLFNFPNALKENILEIIKSCWSYGIVDLREPCIERMMYVAKYIYCDGKLDRKTVENFVFPFILCSRMPGLGYQYYLDPDKVKYHNETLNTSIDIENNLKLPLPRYYRNKIFTEENKEILYRRFIDEVKKPPTDDEIYIFLKRFNDKKRGKSI